MLPPQTLIITGGAGGLASAISHHWSQHQPDAKIHAPTHSQLDVTNVPALTTYFKAHPCDLLICAAGTTQSQLLTNTTELDWQNILHTNLKGAAFSARCAAKNMLRQRTGHIIFISSHSAIHPPAGQAAYAAAKAGLIGLTKSLAQEWGPANIRVNAILPGWLHTPMTQNITPQRTSEVLATHTLGRFNTPAAVAAFIHTLHTQLPHTSGQIFTLDSRII